MIGPRHAMKGILSSKFTLLVVATGMWLVGSTVVASRLWGLYCPFRMLTGLDCPGCGATRAVVALAEGDISLAADENLLVVMAPAIGIMVFLACRLPLVAGRNVRTFVGVGTLAVLAAWTITRNVPSLDFLRSG